MKLTTETNAGVMSVFRFKQSSYCEGETVIGAATASLCSKDTLNEGDLGT